PRPVTDIEWGRADALPFPLCVSSVGKTTYYDDVGVALGNIVLADHGMTVSDERDDPSFDLSQATTSLVPAVVPLPNPALAQPTPVAASRCDDQAAEPAPARYRPRLANTPITQAAGYDSLTPPASARATMGLSFDDPHEFPLPVISL